MSKIVLESRDYDCWTNLAKNCFDDCNLQFASIFGPYWKRLQAYIVRFGFEIASILGLHYYHDCKHISSQLLLSLQAYVVHPRFLVTGVLYWLKIERNNFIQKTEKCCYTICGIEPDWNPNQKEISISGKLSFDSTSYCPDNYGISFKLNKWLISNESSHYSSAYNLQIANSMIF